MKDFAKLEERIGVKFKNIDLLMQAAVHRSYLNENPGFKLAHNERLEFLGDAVLELIVTEYLFQKYPQQPEGELTSWRAALVNAKMLAEIANRLEIDNYLLLSKGEAKDTGRARQYILANALEAMIGAMYLDQGYEITSQFIEREILKELPRILENQLYRDPKSRFQEMAQDRVGITPIYKVLKEQGPDHAKHFTVGVFLDKELVASGEGVSKQEAQEKAAQAGLKEREWG